MPELPDVSLYVESLERRVVHHPLEQVRLMSPFVLRTAVPPLAAVAGRRVNAVRRIAKRIVIALEGEYFLVLHLMIAGRLRWIARGDKPPGRITLALFDFPSGTLVFTEAGTKKRASLHIVQSEGALAAFQKSVDERLQRGVEEAKEKLQTQLQPLMQTMDATWQAKQQEWIEQIQRSTDESIEHYKSRLENASNSWLLASATTLGQHSQAVLDTIAKAAEKRLRETCRDVLAGMGDTLKERMMGLSTGFRSEDEDDEVLPKK